MPDRRGFRPYETTRDTMMSPVQRSSLRRYKLVVRAVLIGSVWSVLTSAIIAQELVDGKPGDTQDVGPVKRFSAESPREELDAPSTKAEGGLSSEADAIGEQARQVQPLNDGEKLLTVGSGASSSDEKAKTQNNSGKKAAG